MSHLLDARLSHSAISRRVARGNLHRKYPGVYAIGHTALSQEGEWLAGVFAGGEGAALGHLAAARLLEAWRYRVALIHIVVPRKLRPRGLVRFHKSRLHPDDVTVVNRIPVTTMARTLVDLTGELTKWELTNIIHEAAFRNRFDLRATQDAMARAAGRPTAALEAAIEMHVSGSAGTKSRLELKFLTLNERAGHIEPLVNTQLNGYEVDFHWPAAALAIELDGPGHERVRTREEDARKQLAWREAGYEVLRFAEPLAAVAEVTRRAAAARRRGRPAPRAPRRGAGGCAAPERMPVRRS